MLIQKSSSQQMSSASNKIVVFNLLTAGLKCEDSISANCARFSFLTLGDGERTYVVLRVLGQDDTSDLMILSVWPIFG